jgi:transposase
VRPNATPAAKLVQALVAVLTPLVAQIQQLSAAITAALDQHPDGPLLQSLPRSGHINAAQILAELAMTAPASPARTNSLPKAASPR